MKGQTPCKAGCWARLSSSDRRCAAAADEHSWITSQSCTRKPGPSGALSQHIVHSVRCAGARHGVRRAEIVRITLCCMLGAHGSSGPEASTFAAGGLPRQLEGPQQHIALGLRVKGLQERCMSSCTAVMEPKTGQGLDNDISFQQTLSRAFFTGASFLPRGALSRPSRCTQSLSALIRCRSNMCSVPAVAPCCVPAH